MSLKKYLVVLATAMLIAPSVLATVVINPGSIIANTLLPGKVTDDRLIIDQSGLSPGYTTGMTSYDQYIVQDGTIHTTDNATGFQTSTQLGEIDFSLGGTYLLTNFALWNGPDILGISAFNLFISTNSSFMDAVMMDPFSAASAADEAIPQSFNIVNPATGALGVTGAFVRFEVTASGSSNNIVLGEVAFGGTMASIPEPASAALLSLGLAGFGFWRRRFR